LPLCCRYTIFFPWATTRASSNPAVGDSPAGRNATRVVAVRLSLPIDG
jgi:hypothetical protein